MRNLVTTIGPPAGAEYTNKNQNLYMQYDGSGKLTNDGGQQFQYNATGKQSYTSYGDGLRLQKTENGVTTYYLRSRVLGQQVAGELNAAGQWQRGYGYLGGQLLAIQDVAQNKVLWAHQEPYSKGQRLTDTSGTMEESVGEHPFCALVFDSYVADTCFTNESVRPGRDGARRRR